MAFCGKCGAQVADGVAYCPACGTAVGATASAGASANPSGGAHKVGGLDSNVAGALAYIWVIAIVWLVAEPFNKDRFLRFHAVQSLGLSVVSFVGWWVFWMIPFLGWLAAIFWPLVVFATWVICVVNAFQNKWFKLPIIGDFAMQQAGPEQK